MVENNYIVYIHRNKINNKCYIGITCQKPNQRWINGKGYMGKRKNGDYSQPKFAHAIEKYGWDNFEHIIWAEGLTRDKACEAERLLIDLWDTINNGYNSLPGGINNVLSWESKQKLGKSQKQISNVCRLPERYKTAGGFVWRFYTEEFKEVA